MRVRRVTITRAAASFSTAASHVSDVSLPCEPWETPYERPSEAGESTEATAGEVEDKRRGPRHLGPYTRSSIVTNALICVATRVKELRKEVSDAEWEGKDTLQRLTTELKYYERLANDGVRYDPTF